MELTIMKATSNCKENLKKIFWSESKPNFLVYWMIPSPRQFNFIVSLNLNI